MTMYAIMKEGRESMPKDMHGEFDELRARMGLKPMSMSNPMMNNDMFERLKDDQPEIITAEKFERIHNLSKDVLNLSRSTLLVNMRFLDMALARFHFMPYDRTLSTDGQRFMYNPYHILRTYKVEKERPVRDMLHVVMHCVFRHPFVGTLVDKDKWDLACDIAVEATISDLGAKCTECARQRMQARKLDEYREELKFLNAERLYRYFLDQDMTEAEIKDLRQYFMADEHNLWYEYDEVESESEIHQHIDNELDKASIENAWKYISERMKTDMETFGKDSSDGAGSLTQSLAILNREKYDYAAFLKKFAIMGETMKINDDEFDYIFYTYGMKLYDKMPLIEPLEYKEVKRIKEFVIAIDTSASVSGELVQMFVQKTYNILNSIESYFTNINLHIIQCDADIQEDVKITSKREFDEYIQNMEVKGFGGTDFRPVFTYVDRLVQEKEFNNLRGLIYLTDGEGTFPQRKPEYNTAFIFIDDDYKEHGVPPWAIKLILESAEINMI